MELLGAKPGRRIILYFLLAITAGTILLLLPISARHESLSFIDALFTATSAVCVTGLTVVSTGKDFSFFGQIVILTLIQLGGLGIMTFATALLSMAGVRMPILSRIGLSESFTARLSMKPNSLLFVVFITTLFVEIIGAALLFIQFVHEYPAGQAAYYAVFHSISAFCNAGFSIFDNSLEGYSGNIYMILIFSFLIITGGLGFVVIRELYERFRSKENRLSLHTRLCLAATAILLVVGTTAFLVAEYDNAFSNFGPLQSAANAFFQSVTARTAGFNTISQPNFTEVSLLITILLMFIGACPGSTGGGIKTTTIAIIALLVINRFLGRQSVSAFKKSISFDSVVRAVTVFLLAALLIIALFALVMFAEERPVAHSLSRGWFVDNLFETVSAFGTVGLSLGMTGHLHSFGKIIIILAMFIGRVGLLTLAFALARPPQKGEIVYIDEPVMVG